MRVLVSASFCSTVALAVFRVLRPFVGGIDALAGLQLGRLLELGDRADRLVPSHRHGQIEVGLHALPILRGRAGKAVGLGLGLRDDALRLRRGRGHGGGVLLLHGLAPGLDLGVDPIGLAPGGLRLLPGHRSHLGRFGLGHGADLRRLVGRQPHHARDPVAHALRRGGRHAEAIHVAAEVVDLVLRLVQQVGQFARMGGRGVTIGCQHPQLGLVPVELLADLVAVVTAEDHRERRGGRAGRGIVRLSHSTMVRGAAVAPGPSIVVAPESLWTGFSVLRRLRAPRVRPGSRPRPWGAGS